MPDYVFPSKLVSEKIELFFDFTNELAWGETLFSWQCYVETYSGDDDSPSLLLAGQAAPVGNKVKQKFYQGIPGVIYTLICEVVGSTGATYRKVGKLAILPDAGVNPPFFANFLTTGPYPVDVQDQIATGMNFVSGRLVPQPFPLDNMQASVAFITGNVYGGAKSFVVLPEAITVSVALMQADVFGHGKTINVAPEGVRTGVLLMSGDLFGHGLTYQGIPEKIQTVIGFISGTLS
jgi:hypothetical protein